MMIPCAIKDGVFGSVLRDVASAILESDAESYVRLLNRNIVQMEGDEILDMPLAHYDDTARKISIRRSVVEGDDKTFLEAILAHELGHACTKPNDTQRCNCPVEKWSRELCANRYAFEWGFAKQIRSLGKETDWYRHLPGVEYYRVRRERWYRVSQDFVWQDTDRTRPPDDGAVLLADHSETFHMEAS